MASGRNVYNNIGQLTGAYGHESSGTNRLHEQFTYAYDQSWNLKSRTKNGFVESFAANNLNELSSVTNSGTLTVAGTLSRPAVNVTVSGTGFPSADSAELYGDNTWARPFASWTEGSNYFTATAQDYPYGRHATNTVASYLSVSNFFVYDSNGNLRTKGTRIFDYDDENQLIAITEPGKWKSEFAYDGLMRRRVRKEFTWLSSLGNWQLTNEVDYIYDGRLPVQERTWVPIGGGFLHVRYITYTHGADLSGTFQAAGGIGGLLARSDSAPSILGLPEDHNFYADDGMGNITLLINTNGYASANYSYDPFGNITSQSGPMADENLYRFSSKEIDTRAGLSFFLYRFYDPATQRWITQDPLAEIGGINLYAMLLNDPLYQIDPFGLCGEQEAQNKMQEATEALNLALEGIDHLTDQMHDDAMNKAELDQMKADFARLNSLIPSLREALRQAQQNYQQAVAAAVAAAAARQRLLAAAGRTGAVAAAGVAGYMGGRALGRSTPYAGGGTLDQNIQEAVFEPFWRWVYDCPAP